MRWTLVVVYQALGLPTLLNLSGLTIPFWLISHPESTAFPSYALGPAPFHSRIKSRLDRRSDKCNASGIVIGTSWPRPTPHPQFDLFRIYVDRVHISPWHAGMSNSNTECFNVREAWARSVIGFFRFLIPNRFWTTTRENLEKVMSRS